LKELCKHFGICGGCDSQNIAYEGQLKTKEDRIKDIFSPFSVKNIERIVPSPEIFHYRNKMEYAVSSFEEEILIGLRQKKRFYMIVGLEECPIFFDRVQDVFNIFKRWIKKHNIQTYQLRRHSGNIRYAAMRHSKYYDELMVIIVLASEEESITFLVEELKNLNFVKSVYMCINNGLADVSVTNNLKVLYGKSHIKERINGIDYLIGASSFFQTNSYCCGRLYTIIKDETKNFGGQVLDMCCGLGGMTLQVAPNFDKVTGVDISAKNIEDALLNADNNRIDNVEFICDDAESFFLNLKGSKEIEKLSTIILDPPRAGLSKKTREAVSLSGVENIVYVSCNPVNLAEDLKTLTAAYRIEKIIPVDMFPHTRHIEVVAILKRDKV
jgi:23S rRNA (uracil1939-C5)-methyltransferase